MFNIIEPKNEINYSTKVNSFLNLLKIYQNFSLPKEDFEEATFIIASDDEHSVYGGALLLEKSIWDLESRIRQTILTFLPDAHNVWTGHIGFYKDPEIPFSTAKILESHLDFYHDLLETFKQYGKEKNLDFLCLTLNPLEHLKLKYNGYWEYVTRVLPQESSDALFHGILSLDGRKE